MPQNKTPGRSVSTEKMTLFDKACGILEKDVDSYIVFRFQNVMSSLKNNIYTLKMMQQKLQEKYGHSMKLVARDGKIDIFLETVADILSEQWYNERTKNISDELERVIRTAAKLL